MSETNHSSPEHHRTACREAMHRCLAGGLEPVEFDRLQSELLASRELRADFLQAVRVDAALQEEALRRAEQPKASVARRPGRLHWVAAGAAALLALGGWWWSRPQPSEPGAVMTPVEVATLIDARDCQWLKGPPAALDGRLAAGTVTLVAGVAVVEFDDGARLALQGPATLELSGANAARLLDGSATVRCEDGGEGFTLLTPAARVVDLGTEFGVAVAADGATAVEVLDGEVEVTSSAPQSSAGTQFLTAGRTTMVNADGSSAPAARRRADWVRDYTSKAEREERTRPPLLMAHDAFQHGGAALADYAGGDGWSGPWITSAGNADSSVSFAPLEPITARSPQSGGALAVPEGTEVQRRLARALDPSRRQRVYVAFSLHRLVPDAAEKTGRRGAVNLLLRSSADPAAFLGFGLSGLNLCVASDNNSWEKSGHATRGTGPFFIVARIDFRPNLGHQIAVAGYDVTETVPDHPPRTWDLVTRRRMTTGGHQLDSVALRALNPGGVKIANLCIGNSWQAVTRPGALAK